MTSSSTRRQSRAMSPASFAVTVRGRWGSGILPFGRADTTPPPSPELGTGGGVGENAAGFGPVAGGVGVAVGDGAGADGFAATVGGVPVGVPGRGPGVIAG